MRSTKNLGIFPISGWTWQFHTGMSWDNSQIGLMIKDLILEGTPHYKFEFRNQKYVRVDRHQQLFILSNPKSRRLVMRPLFGKGVHFLMRTPINQSKDGVMEWPTIIFSPPLRNSHLICVLAWKKPLISKWSI